MNTWGRGAVLLALSLGSGLATAQRYDDDRAWRRRSDYVSARVLDVRAIYDDAERYCWDEPVEHALPPPAPDSKPEIVGGVVGGVIAKPSAKGPERFAPTPAGSALEEAIARENEYRQQQRYYGNGEARYERRCETTSGERERLLGYEVTFDYDGYTGQVFSERRPGRRIRVRIEDLEY